jgi:hypothetical protein
MEPVRSVGRRLRAIGRPRILPSLFERHPHAGAAMRRPLGLRVVPIEQIVGTARNPSQNTDDFLPLPQLRGRNWAARWQRLKRAMADLVTLPPVDLLQVGDEYWVVDGHNRVAAARRNGSVGIDADVVELLLPGVESPAETPHSVAGTVAAADELRQAAVGRQSRTAMHRPSIDEVHRADLLRGDESLEFPEATDGGVAALDPAPAPEGDAGA